MGTEGTRLLLVEDDAGDARLVEELLHDDPSMRVEAVSARTLVEACDALSGSEFDLVLLGLGLPDSRGIDTLVAVQRTAPTVPIVVLTGAEDQALADEAIRAGAQDSLPKGSLSADLLFRAIRYAVERNRVQSELDEERGRLFRVLDSLPMFVYLQAPDHTIPFANRTFRTLFGDVEGRSCYEVFHGRSEPCEVCPPIRVQETGEPEVSEWTSAAGRTYAIYDQVFPGPGDTPLTLEVGLDITEERRTERALRDSEAFLRDGFDAIRDGISVLDVDLTVLRTNRWMEEMYADRMPLVGRKCYDAYQRRGAPCERCPALRTLETGEVHVGVVPYPSADDPKGWIELSAFPIKDETGSVVRVIEYVKDISDRVVAEAALRESEQRFREQSELLPEVVYECDVDGRITFANRVAFERFGYTEQDLLRGVNALEMLAPEDRGHAAENIGRILSGESIGGVEYTALAKDGSTFPVMVHSVPARRDGELVGLRGVIVDISAQHEAREALRTADEIVSALPTGMLIYRYRPPEDLLLVSGNAAAEPFIDVEKHKGNGLETHWPGPMVERLKAPLLAVAREGGVYDREVVLGSQYAFHMRAFRIPGERIVIAFEDIAERRRAEAEAVEWRNRYERAVEASGHVLYDWDPETDEVTYGGDLERILGYTHAEMAGGLPRWRKLIHPDDRPDFDRAIERLIGTREAAHLRYRILRKDGTYIHVEDDGSFITDPGGRPIRMLGFVKDVTERQLAAERIEESEWRYRSIVELAPTGIVTIDLKGVVTSCNDAFAQMTGYSTEELVGAHFAKLPPARPQDVPKYLRLFRSILAGRTPEPFDASWTGKDGAAHEGEIRVSLMRREGKPWGIQVIVQDISERVAAEAELRTSELRYRSLFEDAILGIYQTTPGGRILAANPALVQMLGYDSFGELAERNLEEEGYEPETPRAEFKRELERLGSFIGRESAWKRRDGTTIYVRENSRVVRDDEGNIMYYEGTIENITERKVAEREAEALRERLELTQYSIDSTEAVVLWAGPDGHLTFVNDAACRMLGYTRDELLGLRVWDLDPEYPEAARATEWEQLKRIETEVSERTFRRKSGDVFPVEITAQYLKFHGEELEFVVAFDITERKRLEAQLRQSQRLESIGTLASGVAHEINNPLTGIINYAQLISDRTEKPKLKEFADGIREEGDRVANIVRNLLSFSRSDREHHSPARMIDIVNASLSLCSSLLRRDQIELELDVPEDLPLVRCRSQEIQQVIINLLTNARDSLNVRYPEPNEDKRIVIRGEVLTSDGREWVRLSVADRGGGIPTQIIDRIFDPFFTTKPRDQGTGLGLSVSYGLVRDQGGRMLVESEEGVGTRFLVDLPLEADSGGGSGGRFGCGPDGRENG